MPSISQLGVEPAWQGHGLATRLLDDRRGLLLGFLEMLRNPILSKLEVANGAVGGAAASAITPDPPVQHGVVAGAGVQPQGFERGVAGLEVRALVADFQHQLSPQQFQTFNRLDALPIFIRQALHRSQHQGLVL